MFMLQDDFIDKNRKDTPNVLRSIINKSTTLIEVTDDESNPERALKTVASSLKFEIDILIEKLKKTVSLI